MNKQELSKFYLNQGDHRGYNSLGRGMHKEDVVHIYNGIVLSHKKENKIMHLQQHGWT